MIGDAAPPTSSDRLDSWKEVAAYLGKGVRTVQRWETTEGLPVHRLGQKRTGSIFAYRSELDAWWQRQSTRLSQESAVEARPPEPQAAIPRPYRKWMRIAAATGLVAVSLAALYVVKPTPRPTPRPVPLTADLGWEYQPTFSPDGRQIAYVARPPEAPGFVFVKTIGADSSTRLSDSGIQEHHPAWSPDGRMIAFLRNTPGNPAYSIVLIPAAGGNETKIAELHYGSKLVWSPDGRWLLSTEMNGKWPAIVAVSVSTGRKHYLTGPAEFGYSGYGLSPDLGRLIFSVSGPGTNTVLERGLDRELNPVGQPRALIKNIAIYEMVVAKDAREIFYTDGSEAEGTALWRCRLAPGAAPLLIHATADRYSSPAVSPDLRRLAFAVDRSYRIATWKLDLGEKPPKPAPLLASTHTDLNPSYSPDGRQIAFHSTRTGASDIWIADRDGANPKRLTFTNARTTATPRWSPDGRWIAFESNESGQTEVYVIRSNGGPVHRLTNAPSIDAIPSWSRDGRTIYFCSDRTGRFEIWKTPAFGGSVEQITHHGGFTAVESADGKFLFYTQTRGSGPLYRLPLPAGDAELIIPALRGLFYAVSAEGVYYQWRNRLWLWRPATREVNEIFEPAKPMSFGMDVSPDGKELLFTQIDAQPTDLYMLEGFH
jgi:eukaryotic-like serine/threonine-protein kinase